jgi:hypothetical protein
LPGRQLKRTEYGQLQQISLEFPSIPRIGSRDVGSQPRLREAAISCAMAMLLVSLWGLIHPYRGIALDAQLYGFQALAILHPNLADDLYLQHVSQDRYTVFSPFYARLIAALGLWNAGVLLYVACTLCFMIAAWHVARELSNRDGAWLALAMLTATGGLYGAAKVFHFLEAYLTARSLAEALVVAALACHLRGFKRTGLLVALAAMFVHPLMALPGLLLVICLWLPTRWCITGAIAGILAALGIALAPAIAPSTARFITVIDPAWLSIVRERSQFLFIDLWSVNDWKINCRPFLTLTLAAICTDDARVRQLSVSAMLVGATGLAIALIAGAIGPVALMLQGQAWRWVWVAALVSVLLLVPTAMQLWRDQSVGPLCILFLVSAWTFEAADAVLYSALPLVLWLLRSHIGPHMGRYLRWAAIAMFATILIWVAANGTMAASGREAVLLHRLTNVLELGIPAVLVAFFVWLGLRSTRSAWLPLLASAALLGCAGFILPMSFTQTSRAGSAAEIREFADWIRAIPPASTVLVAPPKDAGSFVWFTLGRPNYLAADQSAGVVFSRQTAFEVVRRSNVLLPIQDPDWKIMSTYFKKPEADRSRSASPYRTLTRASLVSVCRDPALGFVISNVNVGFDPVRHTQAGAWKDWNLYDCRRVRARAGVS